ncbi:MAG: hypothetical protein ACREID_09390 [Planctomycetota bacterium]
MAGSARAALLALLVTACASRFEAPEELPASREDVTAALYRQLDLVLARQAALAAKAEPEAARERAELLRLAAEIAVRIVRVDPQANVAALVERVEAAR